MPSSIHSIHHRVGPADLDRQGQFSAAAYWSVFQTAAAQHARLLGAATEDLRQGGQTWMLSRMALEVETSPALGEELRIETWPSTKLRGVRAVRDFAVLDAEGALVATASSLWVIVDLASRRPQKIPASIAALSTDPGYPVPEFSPELPAVEPPTHLQTFTATAQDVDQNEHVNNVVYARWALAALPEGFGPVRRFEVHYLAEIALGQDVQLSMRVERDGAVQELLLPGGIVAARVRLVL